MSSSDRRRFLKASLALMGAGALSGCGFEPLYGTGTRTEALRGQIAMAVPESRAGFFMRERLYRLLGTSQADAPYQLVTTLAFEKEGLAISTTNEITRFNIKGTSRFTLYKRIQTGRLVVLEGDVRATTGFSATATTYAAQVAERAAEERLAETLAEKIANRLLVRAEDILQ